MKDKTNEKEGVKAGRRGLFVSEALQDRHALAKEFMKSPEAFAERYGLNTEDLRCPPEAHAAFERAQAFADELRESTIEPDRKSMPKLRRTASKHFGKDVEISLIPFGLQFRERIVNPGDLGVTATGSGTVSFLDTDADVDG